jgi:hypothetical protein
MENFGWFTLIAYTVLVVPFLWLISWSWVKWGKAKRRAQAERETYAYAPDIERMIDKIMRLPKSDQDALAKMLEELLAGRVK